MNTTLRKLVNEHGLASVLAGLRQVTIDDARDLEEMGDPADAATVERLEAQAAMLIELALKVDAMEPVAV